MIASSITPVSIALGVLSTLMMSIFSLQSSIALGLGWLAQEFGMSVPLLSFGLLLARSFGLSSILDHVQKPAMLGLFTSWIAHFVMRTARYRRKAHRLVSYPHLTLACMSVVLTRHAIAWCAAQLSLGASARHHQGGNCSST